MICSDFPSGSLACLNAIDFVEEGAHKGLHYVCVLNEFIVPFRWAESILCEVCCSSIYGVRIDGNK